MVSGPMTLWQIDREKLEAVIDFIFLGSKIIVDSDCSHEIKRLFLLRRKAMTNLEQHNRKQRCHFADKGPYCQSHGFSISHIQIWELDQKEGWALKNWCFQIGVLERALESPLDSKEIKPVSPKGNQPWIFIGRTDAKAPILWPLDTEKSRLIGKKPWCRERLKAKREGGSRGWDG